MKGRIIERIEEKNKQTKSKKEGKKERKEKRGKKWWEVLYMLHNSELIMNSVCK